jgi:hypothetical protein
VARELRDQRLDHRRQAQPAFVERAALGDPREQMREPTPTDRQNCSSQRQSSIAWAMHSVMTS